MIRDIVRNLRSVRDSVLADIGSGKLYDRLVDSYSEPMGDETETCGECHKDIGPDDSCVFNLIGGETYHPTCYFRGLDYQTYYDDHYPRDGYDLHNLMARVCPHCGLPGPGYCETCQQIQHDNPEILLLENFPDGLRDPCEPLYHLVCEACEESHYHDDNPCPVMGLEGGYVPARHVWRKRS